MREMSAGSECSYDKLSPHGFIKSEQYTWCTWWNGDQTERTSHLCGPELIRNLNQGGQKVVRLSGWSHSKVPLYIAFRTPTGPLKPMVR